MITGRSRYAATVGSRVSRNFLALLLGSLACDLGCGVDSESGAGDAGAILPSVASGSVSASEADLIEQLSAIGYLAGSEPAHDSQGVTRLHAV